MKKKWTFADTEAANNRVQKQQFKPTAQQRFQALGRMKQGKMNKTEALFAALLEARKHAGEILWWAFEPINIRLADRTFFKVDFLILYSDSRLQAVDVKGYWTDDARAKMKIAADKIPFPFVAAMLEKGVWKYEYF